MRKTSTLLLIVIVVFGFAGSAWLLASRQESAPKLQELRTDNDARSREASSIPSTDRDRITEQLKADISYLAAANRFPTKGYKRAVNYVVAQAKEAGFHAEVEPVEGILQWERGDSDRCDLILPNGSAKSLRMVALTGSKGGEVEGEVVLVNYLFDKNQGPPPQRFDEGNKKRIIILSRSLEQDRSANGYVKAVVQRNYGAIWAAKYGAAAVLVRSVQTGNGPPHTGAVGYTKEVPPIPAAALSVEAADELEKTLCYGKLAQDQTNSRICDNKVSVRLKIAPKRVDANKSTRRQDNVVIRIPGTTLAEQIVLVGAHLDSHDITPGAADDAAGVASVLAVMREFAKNRPARTLLLVLFADEELGGAGARAFVKRHKKELPQIVAATEIDDGDGPPRGLQITSSESKAEAALLSLRDISDRVGREARGLELRTDIDVNGADIEPLWNEHGIPEVAILQDLTNYFDKHHAQNDTPQNIDKDGLERTTFLLIRLVQVLSSSAEIPLPRGPADTH